MGMKQAYFFKCDYLVNWIKHSLRLFCEIFSEHFVLRCFKYFFVFKRFLYDSFATENVLFHILHPSQWVADKFSSNGAVRGKEPSSRQSWKKRQLLKMQFSLHCHFLRGIFCLSMIFIDLTMTNFIWRMTVKKFW